MLPHDCKYRSSTGSWHFAQEAFRVRIYCDAATVCGVQNANFRRAACGAARSAATGRPFGRPPQASQWLVNVFCAVRIALRENELLRGFVSPP
jgi:hypothetical protein